MRRKSGSERMCALSVIFLSVANAAEVSRPGHGANVGEKKKRLCVASLAFRSLN